MTTVSPISLERVIPPAAVEAEPHAFERRAVDFPYALGEITLFSATFRLWVWTRHFIRAVDDTGPHPAEALDRFVSAEMMRDGKLDGDGLQFPSYPTPVPLPVLMLQSGYLRLVRAQYRRFIVSLTGTFEDYEKKFSSKTRSTLKKKVRKFAELSGGSLEWKVYRSADEMDEFHARAREVSSRTYQETLLDEGLPDSGEFCARVKDLARKDAVRGYVLFHAGRPAAYVYCPVVDGAVIYQYVGYDPEYREQSPGTVLQYVLLESLFRENRHKIFDFTEGEGSHKELFSTGCVRCADLYYFRPTIRNLVLVTLQLALASTSKGAVDLLKRLNLHKRVKALIRFGWK